MLFQAYSKPVSRTTLSIQKSLKALIFPKLIFHLIYQPKLILFKCYLLSLKVSYQHKRILNIIYFNTAFALFSFFRLPLNLSPPPGFFGEEKKKYTTHSSCLIFLPFNEPTLACSFFFAL